MNAAKLRPLGTTGFSVSPVALGCWPIAGVTTIDTNDEESIRTIESCIDLGINHLDTAHAYGAEGESERLIAEAIRGKREQFVIATKCGIRYTGEEFLIEGNGDAIRRHCEESLRRLQTDYVELLYLHCRDESVPLEESASALLELRQQGKTRSVGVSNLTRAQIEQFSAVCPIDAIQLPYNMLQRDIEQLSIPWSQENDVSMMVYWPLMKGLLAGRMPADGNLDPRDSRRKYPMYQGEEWTKNQAFVNELRSIADEVECTVAQLVIAWTIHQPGITTALCGAKRPWQIEETARAMQIDWTPPLANRVTEAIESRGKAEAKRAFR